LTLEDGERKISYVKNGKGPAVVSFYPLSGSSLSVAYFPVESYTLLCVDRPSCGETSPMNDEDPVARIQRHARDVVSVLKHHDFDTVYLLGICLGHPYAIQTAHESKQHSITVKGLTLVAPFVPPNTENSWWLARLGSQFPSLVLQGATDAMATLSSQFMGSFLSAKAIQKLLSESEKEYGGWTDDDYESIKDMALENGKLTYHAQALEARLGASTAWLEPVLDAFGAEYEQGSFPFRIYASRSDKLANWASIEWIQNRCYPQATLTEIPEIHSHEVMTFLGGPARNPVLLQRIVKEWGLVVE